HPIEVWPACGRADSNRQRFVCLRSFRIEEPGGSQTSAGTCIIASVERPGRSHRILYGHSAQDSEMPQMWSREIQLGWLVFVLRLQSQGARTGRPDDGDGDQFRLDH